MQARTFGAAVMGVDAVLVEVEVDVAQGQPAFQIVGLPDAAVRESLDRVHAAIRHAGYNQAFNRRVTINLAPADLRKEGATYDLSIALGILAASGTIEAGSLRRTLVLGELALDGRVRPVRGALSAAIAARREGLTEMIVSAENASEAAVVEEVSVYPARSLEEAVGHVTGNAMLERAKPVPFDNPPSEAGTAAIDFADVRGQEHVKRALVVAAAGGHNVLLIGPPGSGKSMMAARLPTVLPPLTVAEAIETTQVHSVAGELPAGTSLLRTRPFRNPHHSISLVGLVGGGSFPAPGEISLAHNGILFLDEFPEFDRKAVEALRQPLEDGRLTIARAAASAALPARIMLVAAMNPCPCGYATDPKRECRCAPGQVRKYFQRISGPLLDRIDIHVEVPAVPYKELSADRTGAPSADMRRDVMKARTIQSIRFAGTGVHTNAGMTERMTRQFAKLEGEAETVVRTAMTELGFSARAYARIRKVARTIADLEGSDAIQPSHACEAIQYRTLDRNLVL